MKQFFLFSPRLYSVLAVACQFWQFIWIYLFVLKALFAMFRLHTKVQYPAMPRTRPANNSCISCVNMNFLHDL